MTSLGGAPDRFLRFSATMKASRSTRNFIFRYNSKNVMSPVASRYLAQPTHVLRPKIAHMWASRDPNTLWWRVSVTELLRSKRVVRSWAARRVRAVFSEALEERGYDREGRRIARIDQGPESGMDTGADADTRGGLTGTLEIVLRAKCIQSDSETVRREIHWLVDRLIEHIQRTMHQQPWQGKKKADRAGVKRGDKRVP